MIKTAPAPKVKDTRLLWRDRHGNLKYTISRRWLVDSDADEVAVSVAEDEREGRDERREAIMIIFGLLTTVIVYVLLSGHTAGLARAGLSIAGGFVGGTIGYKFSEFIYIASGLATLATLAALVHYYL